MAAPTPTPCTYAAPFPTPPTNQPSCAVPLGGSNSTILDTCCNGEVNLIRTYSGPGVQSDCYQYCNTADVSNVQGCLGRNMDLYGVEGEGFRCFGAVEGRGVEGKAGRATTLGWKRKWVLGLWVVGAAFGVV